MLAVKRTTLARGSLPGVVEKSAGIRHSSCGGFISSRILTNILEYAQMRPGNMPASAANPKPRHRKDERLTVPRADGVRRIVRTIELEPEEFIRIALTIPTDIMKNLDQASQLYGITRSKLIQLACKHYLEDDLLDTSWLRELLSDEDIKRPSGYDVDELVDTLSSYSVTGINEEGKDLTLLPEHLQMIRKALEPERASKGQSKWLEFCEKTGLDPKNIPKDRAVKLVFAETIF
jgi:hypothetical protein